MDLSCTTIGLDWNMSIQEARALAGEKIFYRILTDLIFNLIKQFSY
jgi:hypothetical protein